MPNPYRPALFSRETVYGVIGAAMVSAGIAGWFTIEWWAGPVYVILMGH